jgi:DNA-binding response OmpR family regulator
MVPVSERRQVRRARILIVDDSITFRSTLGERLRRDGHDILLAESGTQGVEMLAEEPDAVIVDLEMPGIDGIETCGRIRNAIGGAELPILMLTARDDLPARMQGRAAGANEFLVKVADFESVVARVADFVRRMTGGPVRGPTTDDASVFAEVVAASGVASIIAEAAIRRACRRAGVLSEGPTAADLQRALPDIERCLGMFLPAADRATRLGAVAAVVRRAAARAGVGA